MTKVKSEIRLETRNIRFKRQLKLNAWCCLLYTSMVYIKYFVPAGQVTIWSYSIISIAVSLVVGIPASIIWRNIKGDKSEPAPDVYKRQML